MDYRVEKLSLYGKERVKLGRKGFVHSVYKRAINLQVDGKLISMQPSGSPMSPLSYIVDISQAEFERLWIEKGAEVYVGDKVIEITTKDRKRLSFRLDQALELDLNLRTSLERSVFLETSMELGFWIEAEKKRSNSIFLSMKQEDPFAAAASQYLSDAWNVLKRGRWEEAAVQLCHLLGLGIGLTPSGDDFLCGVLAGLILSDQNGSMFTRVLQERLRKNLYRTNDLSRAFLECALEGQFAQTIHRIGGKAIEQIISDMKMIGSTSGMDTLCGVLYIFRYFGEQKEEESKHDD